MCDSPSLYIDKNLNELIIFNYCDSNQSLSTIENKIIFKITNIEKKIDGIVVFAEQNLKLTFKKEDKLPIFQMKVEGDFPNEYVGSDLKSFFTFEPEKFQKEDCGDFDG